MFIYIGETGLTIMVKHRRRLRAGTGAAPHLHS